MTPDGFRAGTDPSGPSLGSNARRNNCWTAKRSGTSSSALVPPHMGITTG
eukprot:CAMPEP_0119473650 /NCGR_PEP_ID=MMETSP1344-20130328/5226_1 /TAXON_ID=236787 /ORGANISM="Florenciella parvula, Strain CCMP2471" /LENGTH=49 /DNA_ID= /DNA_START= /DNA_END= /DNA_ORIENTATION=